MTAFALDDCKALLPFLAYHTSAATPILHEPLPLSSLDAVQVRLSGPRWQFSSWFVSKVPFQLMPLLCFYYTQPHSFITAAMSSSKLPPRNDNVVKSAHENPVWTLSSTSAPGGERASPAAEPPLTSMCDVHARPDAVCCRTLKGDDERSLIDPDIVK